MGYVFDPLLFSGFVPSGSGSGGVPIFPTMGGFPPTAAKGSLAVAADTGILYEFNGTSWVEIAGPGVMTSVGPIDSQAPSANGAIDVNNQLILQSASATVPGLVNNAAQTFSGQKTFSTGLTGTLTGHATLDLALTGGTMSGVIDMGANKIIDLANPTSAQDAMTFGYANATYIPIADEGVPNGVATLDPSGKIPSSQLPSTLLEFQGLWNPTTNTPTLQDTTGTNGFTYSVSAAFAGPIAGLNNPTMVNFQVGNLVLYTSAISQWEQTTPAAGVQSVNGAQGVVTVNAINQLTGDVTAGPATQSQSQAATVAAIQGTTVSGTTGSTNVVFSNNPTLTGTLNAGSAVFTGTISASNLTGTNSGDLTLTPVGLTANANAASLTGQVLTLEPFSSAFPGVVTASGGGITNYLRADGTWNVPAGTGANTALSNLTITSINQDLLPQPSSSATLYDNRPASSQFGPYIPANAFANRFSPSSSGTVTQVITFVVGTSTTSGTLTCNITSGSPTGTVIGTGTVSETGLSNQYITFNVTPTPVVNGNTYYAVFFSNDTSGLSSAGSNSIDPTAGFQSTTGTGGPFSSIGASITAVIIAASSGESLGGPSNVWVDLYAGAIITTPTSLVIADGSQGTAGEVWTSIDTAGTGHWVALPSTPGDINQTAFTIANGQASPANVTGLAFANGSVRSALIQYSITISATTSLYESGTIKVIQNASGWNIAQEADFDNTNVIFSITSAGQVQYISPSYPGYTNGKMQFRATVTGV